MLASCPKSVHAVYRKNTASIHNSPWLTRLSRPFPMNVALNLAMSYKKMMHRLS